LLLAEVGLLLASDKGFVASSVKFTLWTFSVFSLLKYDVSDAASVSIISWESPGGPTVYMMAETDRAAETYVLTKLETDNGTILNVTVQYRRRTVG